MPEKFQTEVFFNEIEDESNNRVICVSDSVIKMFTLDDRWSSIIRESGGFENFATTLGKFAVNQAKLKFNPALGRDPVSAGLDDQNLISIKFNHVTLVFTASLFQNRHAIFVFVLEEIKNFAHDGQNERKQ